MTKINANRFQAFKKSLDGSDTKWGHHLNLTLSQARDEVKFPLGRQVEKDGTPYIWTYSVMGLS